MRNLKFLAPLALLLPVALIGGQTANIVDAQPPVRIPPQKMHPRGLKTPPPAVLAAQHAAAFKRHGHRMKNMPKTNAPNFDCAVVFGNVLPVDDQGQCGDCYGVGSADGCSMALVKAGMGKADGTFRLSSQYGLDCNAFDGGCDGGDPAQVVDWIKAKGFPLTSDYGTYTANPGRCHLTTQKLWTIADWGYCTPSQQQGVASTEDIKTAMTHYGPIIVCVDAGEFDNYQAGRTLTGNGRNVDHVILCLGWDDAHNNGDGSKGAFIGFNQWGDSWGDHGRLWIKYGADSFGTEAIWVTAAQQPPPPAPVPPSGVGSVNLEQAITAGTFNVVSGGTTIATITAASGVPAGQYAIVASGPVSARVGTISFVNPTGPATFLVTGIGPLAVTGMFNSGTTYDIVPAAAADPVKQLREVAEKWRVAQRDTPNVKSDDLMLAHAAVDKIVNWLNANPTATTLPPPIVVMLNLLCGLSSVLPAPYNTLAQLFCGLIPH